MHHQAAPADAAGAEGTWDGHATRYKGQERLEARAIAAALRLADAGPDDRVVDVATGTGALLRALAAHQRRPATALGVDRSAGMLAEVGGLPQGWRVVRGDARRVPLPGGVADVVTCCYLLQLLGAEDRGRVLREARRLLAPGPGSRVVLVTPWADPRAPVGPLLNGLLRHVATAAPRRFGGLMPLDPTPELEAAGLVATRRVVLRRGGYPSLVVRAIPATRLDGGAFKGRA